MRASNHQCLHVLAVSRGVHPCVALSMSGPSVNTALPAAWGRDTSEQCSRARADYSALCYWDRAGYSTLCCWDRAHCQLCSVYRAVFELCWPAAWRRKAMFVQ